MGLKLDQSLVGHSPNLCHLYHTTHLVGMLNVSSEGLWLDWCSKPSTENLGYRKWPEQALYPPLLGIVGRVSLVDSWEFPWHEVSSSSLRFPSIPFVSPSTLFLYYPSTPTHLIPSVLIHTHHNICLCLLPWEIEPSLLLSLSLSVDCSIITLHFAANAHL